MRVLLAFVVIALCIAGVTPAGAADMPAGRFGYSGGALGVGERSAQTVVYDYQPGVVVRAYWLAPWHHHHYYPMTGEQPEIGRDEDLSAPRHINRPAPTFKRSWSNASAFPSNRPPMRAQPPRAPDVVKP